jgi:hypothetical protein
MDVDQVLLILLLMEGLPSQQGLKFKNTLENVFTSFPGGKDSPPPE